MRSQPCALEVRGIASLVVRPVLAALREMGFDAGAKAPKSAGLVHGDDADAILNLAAKQLGDEALGVSLALRLPLGALGPTDYAIPTSTTTREGLTRAVRYYGALSNRVTAALVERGPLAALVYERARGVDHSRHWIEFAMAIMVLRLRQSVGGNFQLERVCFAHAAPADTAAQEKFFGTELCYDAPRDELTFSAQWLDAPLRDGSASIARALDRSLRALPSFHADGFLERVNQVLNQLLDEREVRLEIAAERLQIARRTLQRELSRRGTSHQALLDELRRARAHRLLDEGRLTVAEIARRLAFSDPSAFFRSFRRWTGTSPRAALRALA
jgi:AraC-like DNA-binding protein